MFQTHSKKIRRIGLIFFLSINFILTQGLLNRTLGYEGPTTTDLQNLLNILSLELPPNTVIPPIPPTSPESSEPILPKYLGSNQHPGSLINTPEPTDQLFHQLKFNPLAGDKPLLPCAEYYAITICLTYNEIIPPGCIETNTTPAQAAEILASFILNKSLKNVLDRPFRIIFPSSMPEVNQIQILRQIEIKTINIIDNVFMQKAEKKHLKNKILSENMDIARRGAASGTNWTHSWQKERSIHHYNIPNIYEKLKNVSISER